MILLKSDERGFSLIELLATLVILSIISVIIWSVFFQGYKFSQKSISKNLMLQESNILVASLTNIHQTVDNYDIKNINCDIVVTNFTTTPLQEQEFHHDNICFKLDLKIDNVNVDISSGPVSVIPNKKDVDIKVTASDRISPNNNIVIDTILYRMKGVGN